MVREAVECQAARLYCGKPILDKIDILLSYADEIEKKINAINWLIKFR
jgi:hypothetical protein